MSIILDISHHQDPTKMNYKVLAEQVDFVIIRTQYGSALIDRHYKVHHQAFQKHRVPAAAYAWVRGVSIDDMKKEATDFFQRTIEFHPSFWFLDVEEKSMRDMRQGVQAYVQQLRYLGVEKIGIYIGHHLYKKFQLDYQDVDAVWIPHYGKNDGTITSKPDYLCDIHQYTDKGKLTGYDGNLDLNRLMGSKPLSFFTKQPASPLSTGQHPKVLELSTDNIGKRIENIYHAAVRFYDSPRWDNPSGTFSPGEGWIIQGKYMVNGAQMYQVRNSKGDIYYITANPVYTAVRKKMAKPIYHKVQKGDTISALALHYNTTAARIKALNQLDDINKIYIEQTLRIK